MLEIHDELAAQIQNSTEAVEYIDGVSSIAEEDDEKSTLTSIAEERNGENVGCEENKDDEQVQIDTFRVIGIRRSLGECLVRLLSGCKYLGESYHSCISIPLPQHAQWAGNVAKIWRITKSIPTGACPKS